MLKAKFFLGYPVDFNGKLKIYPPQVKDIFEEKHFDQFRKILTISYEDIEDEIYGNQRTGKEEKVLTPYEYLFSLSYKNPMMESLVKDAFYFFTKQTISFLYDIKKIVIGDLNEQLKYIKSLNELVFLEEEEYFDFQNLIRNALGEKSIEPPKVYSNYRIASMKAKARYRDRVKAKQKGNSLNFEIFLAVICCMGYGLNPLNIGELSYASLNTLMGVYQQKEGYELDMKCVLSGMSSKKNKINPKYWIRNLDD